MHAVLDDPLTGEPVAHPRLDAEREWSERLSFCWRRLGPFAGAEDLEKLFVSCGIEYLDTADGRAWFRVVGDGSASAWQPVP